MNTKNERTVGVVVGRFQTPTLHEGHRHLIETAYRECGEVLIVVGVNPGWTNRRDPLDYYTRALMLRHEFPGAKVFDITDHPSNAYWSENLDKGIATLCPGCKAVLYGSRNSFRDFYCGRWPFREIEPVGDINATALRDVVKEPLHSADFRTGAIYAALRQNFPTSFQAVDIAICHSLEPTVIIGRKQGEEKWRFPGGFVSPSDASLEDAARREAHEEVGFIELGDIRYVRSFRIDDFRYRTSEHKLMSAFFTATYVFGPVRAGDDLYEVRWHPIRDLPKVLCDAHLPMGQALIKIHDEKTLND